MVAEMLAVDRAGVAGDADSRFHSATSADGRFVAFVSSATNLDPGGTSGVFHVYRRDTQLGTTELVSVSHDGGEGDGDCDYPSISTDGRYVGFQSDASNLVTDDDTGATATLGSGTSTLSSGGGNISNVTDPPGFRTTMLRITFSS